MSSSPERSAESDAPTREEQSESSTFTLQIISPNSGPLSFSNLPVTTTVKQLKAKIRDELPSKPVDEHQRIIYRGRMLAIENATMTDVFGKEALATREPQNLHLVLRQAAPEASTSHNPPQPAVAATQAPPTIPNPPLVPQLINRPQSTPAIPGPNLPGMQGQQPLPGFQQMQQNQALHQMAQMNHVMTQRLAQLQQESQRLHQEMSILQARTQPALFNGQQATLGQNPMAHQGLFRTSLNPNMAAQTIPQTLQNLINQRQQERAGDGRHGAQDGGTHTPHMPPQSASGRASPNIHRPDHTTTYTREGVGPNGERFHITVNETTTTLPLQHPHQHHHHAGPHANPALEVQAIMRNADRFMAAQGAQNNMQRSASNPIPAQAGNPSSTTWPGVARPGTPSTIPTPATTSSSPSASTILIPNINASAQAGNSTSTSSNSSEPTVYILSSPYGPRALLVNNGETFYTPRPSRRHSPIGAQGQVIRAPVGLPEFRNRPAGREGREGRAARRNQRPNPLQPVNAAHGNPGAGALAAQVGPMLWLIVRLVGFVWFFTAGNPSWTRWLMVSGLAFLVFLFNTGIFNGAAEQLWGPIRRHLEGLIPLGAPVVPLAPIAEAAQPGQDPVADDPAARRRRTEPDPAEVAVRLLQERRQADRGWLMAQFRRAEHSLLLFLASLVPGVGERHIAAREAEANAAEAERQRLIQEAEAANAVENTENTEGNGEGTTAGSEHTGESGDNQPNQQENVAAPAQPLIEV
ncbi:uncharacterized protein LY89DRAFT_694708 [Mollisia scopiformis]|uniref:Ubiquitin-like domain-containing protein n=1 Tax=Mollisia scopiformis TaxID=149040 RepID=A0A194XLR3_MOLSC|nr:uncharacterized protein LY89DRAFT_694708 [Mollisia scopiformis]KUJ21076.1 hypothetical protein LY89DRAFT_694708 [Mollisia scopiformis]